MATKTHKTKTTRAALAGQMAAGVVKHFPAGAQLLVGGVSLSPAQIQTKLTGFAQLRADVVTARSALDAKLATENNGSTDENAFLAVLEKVIRGSFGSQPDVLGDFGLKPEKPHATLTVEQKAAAAAKRAATRAARGTTGSKAKKAIKGAVTGVVVVPVTAAQPAATATPGVATASNATVAAPAAGATTTVTKGS